MIAKERRPHLTNGVIGDPRVPQQAWAREQGLVSFAGYPLLVDSQLVGVIGMFARKPLSEATLEALQTVSQALAVGIQRKQAQEALREQSEWFRVTLGSIGDAVVTVDTDGWITFLNPVAEALTGWTTAAANGRPMAEVLRLFNEATGAPAAEPDRSGTRGRGDCRSGESHEACGTGWPGSTDRGQRRADSESRRRDHRRGDGISRCDGAAGEGNRFGAERAAFSPVGRGRPTAALDDEPTARPSI